jgi:MFS family permease
VIAGPLLGGLIVKHLSWPWIFFINLPVGLGATAMVSLFLHEQVDRKRHALDFAGAATFSITILLLLLGVSGTGVGLWPLALAAPLLVLFVAIELRAAEPILPIPLMRRKVIALSSVASALVGAAMMATVTYVPLYVQTILGGSPTLAGRAIAPMVVGWPIASTIAGRLIPRRGFRPTMLVGVALTALSAAALPLVAGPDTSVLALGAVMLWFGAGLGATSTTLLLAVQTSVDWRQRGVATAGNLFFRTVGGTLAVGALGGVLAAKVGRVPGAPPGAADALLGPDHGASLQPELLGLLSSALEQALHWGFWAVAALCGLLLLVGLPFPAAAAPAKDGAAEEAQVSKP